MRTSVHLSMFWWFCSVVHHITQPTVSLASAFNRDNVEWTDEQEACAKKKVSENSQPLPSEKQGGVVVVLSDTLMSQHEQHQGSITQLNLLLIRITASCNVAYAFINFYSLLQMF